MPPTQQAVEVPKLFVEIIVTLRADCNRIANCPWRASDDLRQVADPFIRPNPFTVLDPGVQKLPRDFAIDVNARNHQRAEKISLAALIDPEVRLEHFRRMNFFVTELRLLQNFRLQLELNEFFDSLSLHQHLRPFFENRA